MIKIIIKHKVVKIFSCEATKTYNKETFWFDTESEALEFVKDTHMGYVESEFTPNFWLTANHVGGRREFIRI